MGAKLKTYQTSLGFSDQAITAPSMKAALEVALDLGPYAYEVPLTQIRFSDIRHKARRHLRGSQLEANRDPLFTGPTTSALCYRG
jgi:hypothetical protein